MSKLEFKEENEKLVSDFGAEPINKISNLPDFYTFNRGLFYSHRDFDKFLERLYKGEKSAIVSGFNASGSIHLGHKAVFDTNLFFQKEFGLDIYIPISDDESYVSGKVESQTEAMKNSLSLVKELLAYGFDPEKTYFIIDQVYTNIYNYAIMLSRNIIFSISRASYGYNDQTNLGMIFYPTIQSAHILLPELEFDTKNVLVPIGPDEDVHIRVCRDLAQKHNLEKPATIHSKFLPGLDGEKMSKSKNNYILLLDSEKELKQKAKKTLSGGRDTLEEHKKYGGIPEEDVAFKYLEMYFLEKNEIEDVRERYKSGEMTSKDMKNLLIDKLIEFTEEFKENLENVNLEDCENTVLRNPSYNKLF